MTAITDKFGRASIPTDVAIATTVKTTRTAGTLVLEAIDLSKYSVDTPVFFVTYKKTTDPVTGVVSITNLVSYKALVNVGANTLTNLTVAPGYTDLGNAVGDFIECIPTTYWENSLIDGLFVGLNPDGTFKKSALKTALGDDGNLTQVMDEVFSDFILTGGIWSIVSGLNGAMTALTGYIDGYRNTVAAIASRAYTISKDTYVDVLRNTSTNAFSLVYTEVANGAAAPALAANSLRLAIVTTSASAITTVQSRGYDSLGNRIAADSAVPTKQTNDWWEEIGRVTFLSSATSATVKIPPRTHLKVILKSVYTGSNKIALQFNGDTGANYADIYEVWTGGASSGWGYDVNQVNSPILGAAVGIAGCIVDSQVEITNVANLTKQLHIRSYLDNNNPNSVYGVQNLWNKWVNTTAQINSILFFDRTSVNMDVGSEIIILGHD